MPAAPILAMLLSLVRRLRRLDAIIFFGVGDLLCRLTTATAVPPSGNECGEGHGDLRSATDGNLACVRCKGTGAQLEYVTAVVGIGFTVCTQGSQTAVNPDEPVASASPGQFTPDASSVAYNEVPGRWYSNDQYLADFHRTTLAKCKSSCTLWRDVCPVLCLDSPRCGDWSLPNACSIDCGGFTWDGESICSLYPPHPVLLKAGRSSYYAKVPKGQEVTSRIDSTAVVDGVLRKLARQLSLLRQHYEDGWEPRIAVTLIQQFDSDEDGKLSVEEVVRMALGAKHKFSAEEVKAFVDVIDTDGGGSVSAAELAAFLAKQDVHPAKAADMAELPHASRTWGELKAATTDMLRHAWTSYEKHAMGHDELKPISCSPSNPFGGIAVFLVDSLSTLAIHGETDALRRAVMWLIRSNRSRIFDVNKRVSVFEVTIRVLGGLLSAHQLLTSSRLMPEYAGELLSLAELLGTKLAPAFQTQTGIPMAWINMATGPIAGETRETCAAGAGTLLLEFGTLARLTGNETYERLAETAVREIYNRRDKRTGVVGSSIDTSTGRWLRRESGIGAGVDSFYEYLLKSYLVFGNVELLGYFADAYAVAMTHMRLNTTPGRYALIDVDMRNGKKTAGFVSSLGAFWPGMQALLGHVDDAGGLFNFFGDAWRHFHWLPELFSPSTNTRHSVESGYPLRPEHIESAYMLQLMSPPNETRYANEAQQLQEILAHKNRQRCGYSSVQDVTEGTMSDRMETFFTAEACLYLWLVFAGERSLLDYHVLTTEGHPLQVFPAPDSDLNLIPALPEDVPEQCAKLCRASTETDVVLEKEANESPAFATLGVDVARLDLRRARLLRRRRCIACARVDERLAEVRAELAETAAKHMEVAIGRSVSQVRPVSRVADRPTVHFSKSDSGVAVACHLVQVGAEYVCGSLQTLLPAVPMEHQGLPKEVIVMHPEGSVVELATVRIVDSQQQCAATTPVGVGDQNPLDADACDEAPLITAMPAEFGPRLGQAGQRGHLVLSLPSKGCSPLRNAPEALLGAWVVVERGECNFVNKVLNAQSWGASGVIVANTADHEGLVQMSDQKPSLKFNEVRIPSVLISAVDAKRLLQESSRRDRVIVEVADGGSQGHRQVRFAIPKTSKTYVMDLLSRGLLNWARIVDGFVKSGLAETFKFGLAPTSTSTSTSTTTRLMEVLDDASLARLSGELGSAVGWFSRFSRMRLAGEALVHPVDSLTGRLVDFAWQNGDKNLRFNVARIVVETAIHCWHNVVDIRMLVSRLEKAARTAHRLGEVSRKAPPSHGRGNSMSSLTSAAIRLTEVVLRLKKDHAVVQQRR
eukprot:TRINITY_DN7900_c0_g2_i1.p1 TRINITY_DN7900_c0_g2~~TRINITY_DN7900_c0_g2_i1.p1  ORF type:complete len:1321 (+),score=194.44 TRINITY_DN7900_c0_g2_i1:172-4134(+)